MDRSHQSCKHLTADTEICSYLKLCLAIDAATRNFNRVDTYFMNNKSLSFDLINDKCV